MSGEVTRERPVASVIVPAHNEESSILSCLAPVLEFARQVPLDVIVAANGCTDGTVDLARGLPGTRVLDLPVASKVEALNAADEVAGCTPRIYLDADVTLDREALVGLVENVTTDGPRVAVPSVHHNLDDADPLVRRFYRVLTQLPEARNGTTGRGVYAMSAAGRARFDAFPPVLGDDLFVSRMFSADETVTCRGRSVVRPPATWRDLVRVRSRVASGNAQLASVDTGAAGLPPRDYSRSTSGTVAALAGLAVRRPRLLPSILVYVALTTVARMRRNQPGGWERDDSSR